MSNEKPTYEELEQRLAEAQRVMDALRGGEVDAIVSERDVSLLRLKDMESALRRSEEAVRLQRDQLMAHSRILRSILSTHELDELLGLILDEALSLLGVEFASIHLLQKEGLVLRRWRGFSDELCAHMHFFPATDVPNWTRQPCNVHERLSEHGVIPDFAKRDGIQVWASIPLRLPSPRNVEEGEWLGTVLVGSRHYEALNQEEVRLFQGLSDQVALSISHAHAHRAAHERLARLQILHSIDSAIIQGEDMRVVLRNVVNMIPAGMVADAVAISMLDEEHFRTEVFVMRSTAGVIVEEEAFTLAESLLHWLVERQEPVIIYDLIQDPRVQMHRPRNHIDKLVSYLGVPLVARGRTIGILHILTTQPRIFADEDIAFFRTLAGQAAIAVANARLFAALQQELTERKQAESALQTSREQLRALAARLASTREEESALLAREIHDELGQALTGLKMDLSWLASRLGEDRQALKKKADSMAGLVDTTIDSIRNIAARLRPKMLDELGLLAAIEWQAEEFRKHAGVKCEVVSSMDTAKLEPQRSIAVFRIAQEALTNIARHAAATRVDISLYEESGCLMLEVRDNGKGIGADEIAASDAIGLLGMRERALAVGGAFTIRGFPGRGTVVTLRMPFPAR